MQFDPTFDYSSTDLYVEENVVRLRFSGLIKCIFTIAADAALQRDIVGMGAICDELAEELDFYLGLTCDQYFRLQLLTIEQADMMKNLLAFFSDRSGEGFPDFRDDRQLDSHPDWAIARRMAAAIIQAMRLDHLAIKFERDETYETAPNGQQRLMQSTQTFLVPKA
ncbi:hypothetical protein ACQKLP_19095 [Chitinophaga sp. NPDC101104]|uniref:hypothetical protein n=1 Tax=Chitinophaga sp. NPDC101104 TaxID=3390561 RepID=UPI003D093648